MNVKYSNNSIFVSVALVMQAQTAVYWQQFGCQWHDIRGIKHYKE